MCAHMHTPLGKRMQLPTEVRDIGMLRIFVYCLIWMPGKTVCTQWLSHLSRPVYSSFLGTDVGFFSRIMENLLVPVSLAWKLKVSDNQMSPKSLWVTDFPVHCLRINKNKKGEQEVSRREKVVLFRKSGKAPEGELSQERGFCLVSCPPALVSFIMGIWWRPRYHYWDWAIFDHHLTDWISKGPSHPVLFSLAQPERWSCIACSVRGVVICHGHACLLSLNSFYMLHRLWWHHLSFLFPGYITHLWFTGDPCPLLLPACGEPSPVSTHF